MSGEWVVFVIAFLSMSVFLSFLLTYRRRDSRTPDERRIDALEVRRVALEVTAQQIRDNLAAIERRNSGVHDSPAGYSCDVRTTVDVIPGESLGFDQVTAVLCLKCGTERPMSSRLRQAPEYVPAPFFEVNEARELDNERAWVSPDRVVELPRPEDADQPPYNDGGWIRTGPHSWSQVQDPKPLYELQVERILRVAN